MSSRPFIILTLILLGHTGTAAGQGEPLTLEDIVTLKRVASAVLSPDGEHIAYVLNVPRTPYVDENGSAYRELHITDLEGNSRGFITGEVNIGQIAWSADGETVYYLTTGLRDANDSLDGSLPDGAAGRSAAVRAGSCRATC